MGCKWSTQNTSIKCLFELRRVSQLVQQLEDKYRKQRTILNQEIHHGLRSKEDKNILINKLKRKKILEHYMGICQKRREVLMNKEYAVEQLNITAMQIDALKKTVSVFQHFNKHNNIDKIEELQDTLQELTDNVTDIDGLLQSQPMLEFDQDELEKELESLDAPEITPIATMSFPQVPLKTESVQETLDDKRPQSPSQIPLLYE